MIKILIWPLSIVFRTDGALERSKVDQSHSELDISLGLFHKKSLFFSGSDLTQKFWARIVMIVDF